ncbi:MAG: type I-E CRISPR-associated endoribonuclease Cas2 [Candidatus Hydrogenedentes bacterium]|nr:type I-E CRISPR-associated endoribonuclease Cas2 [Candidatus Hydrogenedentota bacterium]
MTVIILVSAPPALRGEVSRWAIEPHPGVFVAEISALVREKLWERCCKKIRNGGVIFIYPDANEQGYTIRSFGNTRRDFIDFDGIILPRQPNEK